MPQHRAPPFSTKARPSPRGFGDYFVANGWTETKLEFQCQTPQMIRWIAEFELSGRDLKAERKAHMRKVMDDRKIASSEQFFTVRSVDGSFLIPRTKPYPSVDPHFDELTYG